MRICLLSPLAAAIGYVVIRVLVRRRSPRAQLSDLQAAATALARKQRISVIGCSCTGKSTLASMLAKIKGVQYIDMDRLAWLPGWQLRDHKERDEMLSKELQQAKAPREQEHDKGRLCA